MNKEGKRRRSVLRWLIPLIVVIVAAGYVFLLSPLSVLARGRASEVQGTATVQVQTINETVEVTGNIEPVQTQSLQFPMSGQLAFLGVEQGQQITKGTLTAALNDTEARYELKSVENQIEKARVTGSTRDVQLLELERQVKLQTIDEMRIVARFDGVIGVLNSSVVVGDYLAAGQSFGSLVDLSSLQASVQVDELDVPKVKVGQPVQFHFEALPQLDVMGSVTAVPDQGVINDQGIAVVNVTLTIPKPSPQIVPPFSFNADIIVKQNEPILVVTADAILTRNGKSYVLVQKQGQKPVMTPVQVQPYEAGTDRVISGLSAGETVLVLKPSARVSPTSSGFFGGGTRGGGGGGGGGGGAPPGGPSPPPGGGSSPQGAPSGPGGGPNAAPPAGVSQ